MNEERMQVLNMLADNKLTVEQANQLLEALGDQPATTEQRAAVQRQTQPTATNQERDPRADRLAQQLADLKAVGVNAAFVREMEALGFVDLTPEQLVDLKAVGVNAQFVREMCDLDFGDLAPDQLQHLKAVGVNAEFIAEMRVLGMVDLDADQLVALRSGDPGGITQRLQPPLDHASAGEADAQNEA